MSHGHYRLICRCGRVLAQCRCIGPKTDRIAEGPCPHVQKGTVTMAEQEQPKTEQHEQDAAPFLERAYHRRLRDFESFDALTFKVVPRYKTSGLSGDEWRQHVEVEFWFKGEVVHAVGFRDMRTALMMAPAEWVRAQEPIPERVIALEHSGLCDQPSCKAPSVVKLRPKRLTADDGSWLDPKEEGQLTYFRQFCETHRRRGDCSREDCDENYEPLAEGASS